MALRCAHCAPKTINFPQRVVISITLITAASTLYSIHAHTYICTKPTTRIPWRYANCTLPQLSIAQITAAMGWCANNHIYRMFRPNHMYFELTQPVHALKHKSRILVLAHVFTITLCWSRTIRLSRRRNNNKHAANWVTIGHSLAAGTLTRLHHRSSPI